MKHSLDRCMFYDSFLFLFKKKKAVLCTDDSKLVTLVCNHLYAGNLITDYFSDNLLENLALIYNQCRTSFNSLTSFSLIPDDMIETENTTLRERVNDLEKKVLEQGDELICLRSTLANVVRRLEQIEGYARTIPDSAYSRYGGSAVRNGTVRSKYFYFYT